MRHARRGNFFEDFRLGQRFVHATPRTLTGADQSLAIALTGSRACLHSADTAARGMGFDRRPLDDLLVFNTAFGKTVPDISLNAVANLGYAELRFLAPVFAGDTIAVDSEVIGLKENSSRRSGVVYVRSMARNQDDTPVLVWVRWVMVHKRDPQARCAEQAVPDLLPEMAAVGMRVDAFGPQVRHAPRWTGIDELWEDYETGERIDHPGAMTVNASDHSLATRLYQNTARAHFDAHGMASTPHGACLVYGGHVLSLCRALAYDGLENVLSMLAVHGGSHVTPTFAGDTLRCATQVVARHGFGSAPVGGLRLRMVAAKNVDSASQIVFPAPGQAAAPVVLDIDFTVAIPKRHAP